MAGSLFHNVTIPADVNMGPGPDKGSPGSQPHYQFIGHLTITPAHVLTAIIGSALFVTVAALIAFGLGAIIRHTAGAITSAIGLLFVLSIIIQILPDTWRWDIMRFFPDAAGRVHLDDPARAAEPAPVVDMAAVPRHGGLDGRLRRRRRLPVPQARRVVGGFNQESKARGGVWVTGDYRRPSCGRPAVNPGRPSPHQDQSEGRQQELAAFGLPGPNPDAHRDRPRRDPASPGTINPPVRKPRADICRN